MSSTEDVKKCKNKRTSIKAQLTKFKTYVDNFDISKHTVIELKLRLQKAEELYEKFDQTQSRIEEILVVAADSSDAEERVDHRQVFEDSYYEIVGQARGIVQQLETPPPGTPVSFASEPIDRNSMNNSQPRIQLPVLTLPKFNGNYTQWLLFKDTYVSTIHNNNALSEIEKFRYLRCALQGDAQQVLASLETTSQNYAVAWKLLEDRYENDRLITHTHMKGLFDLSATGKETHGNLRQLLDSFQMHVRALEMLKEPVHQWDTILIYLLTSKLDMKTRKDWETEQADKKKPKLKELTNFLSQRCQILEMADKFNKSDIKPVLQKKNVALTTIVTGTCQMCHKPKHAIYKCYRFLALPVKARFEEIKRLKLCLNCLREGHQASECHSKTCHTCGKKHNSLLHQVEAKATDAETKISDAQSSKTENTEQHFDTLLACNSAYTQTLLPTALLRLYNQENNKYHEVRALLDSGSQSNIITRELCNKLNIKTNKSVINISGLNQAISKTNLQCNITICSRYNSYKRNISCLVLDNITSDMPTPEVDAEELHIPKNLQMADETFYTSNRIELLLGVSTFFDILRGERMSLGRNKPMLQNTLLGWIIAGNIPIPTAGQTRSFVCIEHCKQNNLHEQLEKFWQVEESPTAKKFSKEEEECLIHFDSTTTRHEDGKFIVNIPLKETADQLGHTLDIAIKRLQSIERKFKINSELQKNYLQFMTEYEALGHMTRIENVQCDTAYYLPHHPVLKSTSLTTKTRVVFDGSAQPPDGLSLNQIQKVGPTIQQDIFTILARFRTHAVAITADVEKMYRQISVDKSQRDLQRIVWRVDPNEEIQHFQLNTVTYGQAASSFLAIRCLTQLALDNKSSHPHASEVIEHDFYVDDLLSGAADEEAAEQLYSELKSILATGKMNLRKWCSNSSEVLKKINENNEEASIVYVCENASMKALGIQWNPQEDIFQYVVNLKDNAVITTKRIVLSIVSQIYDPLGLVSPIIIVAKIFIQKLWQEKLNWDEPLKAELYAEWRNFLYSAQQVNQIKIPRFLSLNDSTHIEMHCFCDASTKAYAACLYLRVIDNSGNISVRLICAKTKVAPLKSLSTPRLELCGALLLAKLANKTKQALKLTISQITYWSDATVVLGWIRTSPHLLKSFVANRVSEIQSLTSSSDWRHVSTKHNPADIASRGAYSSDLLNSELWWRGPEWLTEAESNWPIANRVPEHELPELKLPTQSCYVVEEKDAFNIAQKYSSMNKLRRIIGYIYRYFNNIKAKNAGLERTIGPLTIKEVNNATAILIKLSQQQSFPEEINQLSKSTQVSKHSKLLKLNPYLDDNGLLRVGGRLANSSFDFEKKHPLILDGKNPITKLIFKEMHVQLLHAGPQLLLGQIRENYWPIGGRNLARETVRRCIKCYRCNPKPIEALMGNLPAHRFEATYPFYITGVDYAGPFQLKEKKGRKARIMKSYISLFICFITKAIHLEIVSELTSEAFIMALRRFVSRRGKPAHVYSDNGTNFVGANNKLRDLGNFLQTYESTLTEFCTQESIDWHFIPAHSPHFGGLWEAGVKSTKYHLRRVMGNTALTFEEFSTVLNQIESLLNSRPLTPLSSDPNDPCALTPAHFLIGRSLVSLPDPNVHDLPENRLTCYARLQQMLQHFWRRWSTEYVSELQQRQKWRINCQNLQAGTVVVVKDDRLPPMSWVLGKVEEVHPGADGVNRVATIRLPGGATTRRAISKICPLPFECASAK